MSSASPSLSQNIHQISQLNAQIKNLSQQISALSATHKSLKLLTTQAPDLVASLEPLRAQKTHLSHEIATLRAKLAKIHVQDNKIHSLHEQKAQKLHDSIKSHEQQKSDLEVQISELSKKLRFTSVVDFNAHRERLKRLGAASKLSKAQQDELKQLEGQSGLLNQYLDLKRQILQINNEIQKMEESVMEPLDEEVDLALDNDRVTEMNLIEAEIDECKLKRKGLDEEIQRLQRQHREAHDVQYRELNKATREIAVLRDESDAVMSRLAKLHSTLHTIHIPFQPHDYKAILGKKGANIKKMRKEASAQVKINVDQLKGICTVTGSDQEELNKIREKIEALMQHDFEFVDLRFQPSMYVNLIKRAPQLRKECKCKVYVDQLEGRVRIQGKADNVHKAQKIVEELLSNLEPQTVSVPVQRALLQRFFTVNAQKSIRQKTGLSSLFVHEDRNEIQLSGTRENVRKAHREIERIIKKAESQKEENFTIPSTAEGITRVLGKGGETIREIEKLSKCKIRLNQTTGAVEVQGHSDQNTALAKEFVLAVSQGQHHKSIKVGDKKALSYLIGANGKRVKKLQTKTRCMYDIKKGSVHIQAPNAEALKKAEEDIKEILKEYRKNAETSTKTSGKTKATSPVDDLDKKDTIEGMRASITQPDAQDNEQDASTTEDVVESEENSTAKPAAPVKTRSASIIAPKTYFKPQPPLPEEARQAPAKDEPNTTSE